MVYVDPGQLKWMPYVKTWLDTLSDKLRRETRSGSNIFFFQTNDHIVFRSNEGVLLFYHSSTLFSLSSPRRDYIFFLFEKYVDEGLKYVGRKCAQAMAQVDISKIITLTHLIEALLTQKGGPDLNQVREKEYVCLSVCLRACVCVRV